MSNEDVPFGANPGIDDTNEDNHGNDTNIAITVTDDNDENVNLIDDNGNITILLTDNTSSEFVDVTNDMESNQNSTTPDNESNESKASYVIVDAHNNGTKEQTNTINADNNTDEQMHGLKEEQHTESPIENTSYTAQDTELEPPPSKTVLSSHLSVDSVGSEPDVNITKAIILCTFVPKQKSGTESTVIAGEIVTVLHSEPITLLDNPLALINNASSDTAIDKIIILDSMHWTKIQSRSGTGVVPSNILQYDENPIAEIWTKIKVQHSYSAKAQDQLTISTHEMLQIYGVVNEDGMILAKRDKDGSEGLIPYNFVEIPAALSATDATKSIAARNSVSSTTFVGDEAGGTRNRSSVSSYHSTKKERTETISNEKRNSVKFVIRDTGSIDMQNDVIDITASDAGDRAKNETITKRIKKFSRSISTTIDKIQYKASKQRTNTLDIITSSSSTKFSAPSGVSSDEVIHDTPYHWDAPLNWKRVYVLQDFNGTQEDIERVYETFIRDKEMRGRHESILCYITDPEAEIVSQNQYDVAAPSRRKKTETDVLKFTASDVMEIAGDPSPEGWIFARFANDKEHKGFIPMSYIQYIHTQSKSNVHTQMNDEEVLHSQIHEKQTHQSDISYDIENDIISNNTDIVSSPEPQQLGSVSPQIEPVEMSPSAKEQLPLHWPFSSYPIHRRTKRSKYIESCVMFVLLVIFFLPILVEPPHSHERYTYVWWVNLWFICIPWLIIFGLRMFELWTKRVSKLDNPNNRLYAILLFYLALLTFVIGLFVIIIAAIIHYKWIKDHSPLLWFATLCEVIVFMAWIALMVSSVLFILLWTFCCRITRNRWETRIEFYCCKREAIKTKRYPRKQ